MIEPTCKKCNHPLVKTLDSQFCAKCGEHNFVWNAREFRIAEEIENARRIVRGGDR